MRRAGAEAGGSGEARPAEAGGPRLGGCERRSRGLGEAACEAVRDPWGPRAAPRSGAHGSRGEPSAGGRRCKAGAGCLGLLLPGEANGGGRSSSPAPAEVLGTPLRSQI